MRRFCLIKCCGEVLCCCEKKIKQFVLFSLSFIIVVKIGLFMLLLVLRVLYVTYDTPQVITLKLTASNEIDLYIHLFS